MNNIRIIKAADNVQDCINLTDIGQELIAQPLTFGCAFDQTCNIDKLDHSRSHLLGMIEISEKLQSLVRYGYNTYIRIDRTERIVGRLCTSLCQGIKKGTFADVWQTHNT